MTVRHYRLVRRSDWPPWQASMGRVLGQVRAVAEKRRRNPSMEQAGLINEYVCPKCGGITRTINRDAGTTPFMSRCRAVIGASCDGMAQSCFYRVSQNRLPAWEWIRPTPEEFEQWLKDHRQEDARTSLAEHVARGGMLLRKTDISRLHSYGFRIRRA